MQSKTKYYLFKIGAVSEFELFWLNYEISKRCPNAELDIARYGNDFCRLSVLNSSLSSTEIESILTENQIEYEAVQ